MILGTPKAFVTSKFTCIIQVWKIAKDAEDKLKAAEEKQKLAEEKRKQDSSRGAKGTKRLPSIGSAEQGGGRSTGATKASDPTTDNAAATNGSSPAAPALKRVRSSQKKTITDLLDDSEWMLWS